jgi:hypothetical protein
MKLGLCFECMGSGVVQVDPYIWTKIFVPCSCSEGDRYVDRVLRSHSKFLAKVRTRKGAKPKPAKRRAKAGANGPSCTAAKKEHR